MDWISDLVVRNAIFEWFDIWWRHCQSDENHYSTIRGQKKPSRFLTFLILLAFFLRCISLLDDFIFRTTYWTAEGWRWTIYNVKNDVTSLCDISRNERFFDANEKQGWLCRLMILSIIKQWATEGLWWVVCSFSPLLFYLSLCDGAASSAVLPLVLKEKENVLYRGLRPSAWKFEFHCLVIDNTTSTSGLSRSLGSQKPTTAAACAWALTTSDRLWRH